jgi:thiol-disulfide isomerase/thioredoxin
MRVEGMTMRIRVATTLLGLLAGAAALAAPQAHKAVATRDPELIDAQGYVKLVQQYRGKPLLVTFWATWCEPCRDEYPMLNELTKQYAPQGLKVVGVNYDQDGDLILMRRFMAKYKPVFPNYRKKPDESDESFRQAVMPGWNGALPASFFYAKDGRQVGQFVGERTRDAYETAIRSLLGSGSK